MEPTREQFYRRRIAEFEMEVDSWKIRAAKAEAEVTDLKAQVARLAEQVAKLLKNSSNSSKPPSSDIVKPPKPPASVGRVAHPSLRDGWATRRDGREPAPLGDAVRMRRCGAAVWKPDMLGDPPVSPLGKGGGCTTGVEPLTVTFADQSSGDVADASH